jgi:hypothetical protein
MRIEDELGQALRRRAEEAPVSNDAWLRISQRMDEPGTRKTDLEPRPLRRGLVIGVAFAVFAVGAGLVWRALAPGGSVPVPEAGEIYRDPTGWSIEVPSGWHAVPFTVIARRATYHGIDISNVPLPRPVAVHGTPLQVSGDSVGLRGIGLVIATTDVHGSDEQRLTLPLSLDDFTGGSAFPGSPSLDVASFSANGLHFVATVKWGSDAYHDALIRRVDSILTTFSPPISAQIELPSRTISSGSQMAGRVIVENNSGRPLHVSGCGSPFQVVLGNGEVTPTVAWPTCLEPITIPVGTSEWPVTISARYSSCGQGAGLVPCDHGRVPPLPVGRYRAVLYQSPRVVVPPLPIEVDVSAASSP